MVLARNQEMNLTSKLSEFEVLGLHVAPLNCSLTPSVLLCACPVLDVLAQFAADVSFKHSSQQSLVRTARAHSNFLLRLILQPSPFRAGGGHPKTQSAPIIIRTCLEHLHIRQIDDLTVQSTDIRRQKLSSETVCGAVDHGSLPRQIATLVKPRVWPSLTSHGHCLSTCSASLSQAATLSKSVCVLSSQVGETRVRVVGAPGSRPTWVSGDSIHQVLTLTLS